MSERRLPVQLPIEPDLTKLVSLEQLLDRIQGKAAAAKATMDGLGGGVGGGGGGGGGGAAPRGTPGTGGVIPGAGTGGGGPGGGGSPGAGGVVPGGGKGGGGGSGGLSDPLYPDLPRSDVNRGGGVAPGGGKGGGGMRVPNVPYPSQGAAMRGLGSIPIAGAMMAGTAYSMFHNYGVYSGFERAQAAVAPFATPMGNFAVEGYSPTEGLQAQLALTRASGIGYRSRTIGEIVKGRHPAGDLTAALGWMRHRGLSAEDIGGLQRPFAKGAGLGGVDDSGGLLGRSLGTALKIGFTEARFPEYMRQIAATVEQTGKQGLTTSSDQFLRLLTGLDKAGLHGSRAMAAATGASGIRQRLGSPSGGDPFLMGMMARRGGWGQGKGLWGAMKGVDAMGEQGVTAEVIEIARGMGSYGKWWLHEQFPGVSRDEIDRMLESGVGGGGRPRIGPGKKADAYLRTSKFEAGQQQKRIGMMGPNQLQTVENVRGAFLDLESMLTDALGPALVGITGLLRDMVDAAQGFVGTFSRSGIVGGAIEAVVGTVKGSPSPRSARTPAVPRSVHYGGAGKASSAKPAGGRGRFGPPEEPVDPEKLEAARRFVFSGPGGHPIDVTPGTAEYDALEAERARYRRVQQEIADRRLQESGAARVFQFVKVIVEGGDGAVEGNTVRIRPAK